MREPLRIAAAQPRCSIDDIVANVDAHAEVVRAAGARVVVFPELSLTGYHFEAPAIACTDARLRPLLDACAQMNAIALVGAPVAESAERAHIAFLRVSAQGVDVVYRKVNVAPDERVRFSCGERPAVLEVDGFRLGLAICRDISVREHARATAALGIDAYVAGVLNHVSEEPLQRAGGSAIARRYGIWVVFASFAGSTGEGYGDAAGCSGIWGPDGSCAAQAGGEIGAIARATLR